MVSDWHKCEARLTGTSMAAPKVSHYAARILYANPELNPQDVKNILCESVIKTPDLILKTRCGGYFSEEVLEKGLLERGLTPLINH